MSTRAASRADLARPTFQAFLILRIGFVVAPILFGLDKFFNFTTEWPEYLAPWLDDLLPGTAQEFMYVVGAVEILAGLLVLVWPKWGSLIVAVWLGGIIVNLLTNDPPEFYDVALRDFGLLLAALALNRLATEFQTKTAADEARELPRAA